MALKLIYTAGRRAAIPPNVTLVRTHVDFHYNRKVIGNREIVCYGFNGEPNYMDRVDFPFPAIRWKETTPELLALKEKERGDWKVLSREEKKLLYRSSFRQTLAEVKAPTGYAKSALGIGLLLASIGLWMHMFYELFVNQPLPDTYGQDKQKAQLRRILDLHTNEITGIASRWDYERDRWKK